MKIQLASCVITDDYDRILLLHRSSEDTSQWELPGAQVKPGEVAEQALVESLSENLGIAIRLSKALGFDDYEDGEEQYHCTWFQAVVTGADPALHDTTEYDDLDYFEIEDLMSLSLSTEMQLLLDKIVAGEVALD